MNITDAVLKMSEGHKVKLPEWTGYWFIPNHRPAMVDALGADAVMKEIRVFAKNGHILDTPWITKYITREDFEITDGALGYDFAILAMDSGNRVARYGWNGGIKEGMYVQLVDLDIPAKVFVADDDELLNKKVPPFYILRSAEGTLEMGWRPTPKDMRSKDWYVVPTKIVTAEFKFMVSKRQIIGAIAKNALQSCPQKFPFEFEATLADIYTSIETSWVVFSAILPYMWFEPRTLVPFLNKHLFAVERFKNWNLRPTEVAQGIKVDDPRPNSFVSTHDTYREYRDDDFIDLDALIRNVANDIIREERARL